MRIGLFTDTYTPDINGVVTSIVTLKDALEREGHTVFVITNQASIINTSYEDQVLRLPGVELKFLYGYVLSSPIHINALATVKDMDLDVIHVHSEFGVGIFARMVAKNLHIPMVCTYHTTYEDYTHYVNLLGLKSVDQLSKIAVAKMSRFFTKNMQVIIAPSEKTQKMLLGYSIQKEITVIPTGLDLSRFDHRNSEAIENIRNKYELNDVTTYLYVGRLAKEKSIDVVIEGFKELLDQGAKAKLLIVGGGPSEDDLKDLTKTLGIENNVHFVGPVASHEVVNYYHSADVFTSASLTETQGLTYIEALACGLCVFARPDKPLEGIIIDGNTGYLFKDSKEFASKSLQFINADKGHKDFMKNNALNKAQTFDSKNFARDVAKVYKKANDLYHGRYVVESVDMSDESSVAITISSKGNVETLIVDEFLLRRKELKVGDEMSRIEINELEDDQQVYSAFQLALTRISKKDYTSFEIQEYLRSKTDLKQEQIDIVVDLLVKRRFIDDERYFKERIDYGRSQLRGNIKIADDLISKGFNTDEIYAELESENREDYVARGIKRAEKILETSKEGSKKMREDKVSQHLVRQGYEYEVVKEILGRLEDPISESVEIDGLRKLLHKARDRYSRKSKDLREMRNKVVKYALSKGYDYDKIKEIVEEMEHED